jgi:uncharacterized protein YkwD
MLAPVPFFGCPLNKTTFRLLLCLALLTAFPAQARDRLVDLINAFRAAPQECDGRRLGPVAPLARHPALVNLQVPPGAFLEQALSRAGYKVARAEALFVASAQDEQAVMAAIAARHCRKLMSTAFSAVGAGRSGDSWLIVLAQPAPPSRVASLAPQDDAGKAILEAVNRARAEPRSCGDDAFLPSPPLAWNGNLAQAARAHSTAMAQEHFFNHTAKDGGMVGERALAAGYRWRRIGENIAAGQESPDAVVADWLTSPGHCANIMDAGFTDMGSGYAINRERDEPRVYWTQVFGIAR